MHGLLATSVLTWKHILDWNCNNSVYTVTHTELCMRTSPNVTGPVGLHSVITMKYSLTVLGYPSLYIVTLQELCVCLSHDLHLYTGTNKSS